MTNKRNILDCISSGDDYGECETQIIEYFQMMKVEVSVSEIRNLLSEMVKDDLINFNNSWTNECNETPYILTPKGRKILNEKL